MGVKLRGALEPDKFNVPGPGSYTNAGEKLKAAAPQFGFGTSKRPEGTGNKKNLTPGPGEYKLKSRMANVEDFAMPGRDKTYANI